MTARTRFDKPYFDRFYGNSSDRARYRRAERKLGAFIFSYLEYLGQPVRRVLDVGCGLGQWRDIVSERYPDASYTGVEWSQYLCEKYGWIHGSAVDFESDEPFDLVICKDTLQYLDDRQFRRAAANLAHLSRGALYASILTVEDWHQNCDRDMTDDQVFLRTGRWYRKVLGEHFINLGGGLFLSELSPAIPWELETSGGRAG